MSELKHVLLLIVILLSCGALLIICFFGFLATVGAFLPMISSFLFSRHLDELLFFGDLVERAAEFGFLVFAGLGAVEFF